MANTQIPASLRPFTVTLTDTTCRVRLPDSSVHCVYIRGHLLGTIIEGKVSAYFRTESGHGKMYPDIETVDSLIKKAVARR